MTNRTRLSFAAFLWLLCILPAALPAVEMTLASRQIYTGTRLPSAFVENSQLEKRNHLLQSLNRFSFRTDLREQTFRFEYELSTSLFSNTSQMWGGSWAASERVRPMKKFKTDTVFLNSSKTLVNGQIERLEMAFSFSKYDVQMGRQPISLGTSHYVSVCDVLAPFHPGYLDGSFKPGVDAIRIRTQAGLSGEIELIFVAAAKDADNSIIARFRDTYSGFDIESATGRFRQRNFASTSFEGEKRRYNIWGEMALFERLSDEPHFGGFSRRFAGSWIIGAERSSGNKWRHGMAIMHQDFGAREVSQLSEVAATLPFRQGWAFMSGSDYLVANSSREMNPLTSLNLNIIGNLKDRSSFIQPVIDISTGNESDLSIFGWLNTGKKPDNINGVLKQNSEFGSHAVGIGLIYRRYFGN